MEEHKMVLRDFKNLSEMYVQQEDLIKAINCAEEALVDFKILGKYASRVDKSGVSIPRKNKWDIIPTEDVMQIEKETGTRLMYVNDNYYMFAWQFQIDQKAPKKRDGDYEC